MDKSFKFYDQVIRLDSSKYLKSEYWDKAVAAYENKKPLEVIDNTIQYIKAQTDQKLFSAGIVEKYFLHGSIKIYVRVKNDTFSIYAPFLKISQPVSISLLRKLTEINFGELNQVQIILNDNNSLSFYFEEKVSLIEPYKLFELFRQISFCSDYYDDLFIDKYKAEHLEKAEVKPFSSDKMSKALDSFQNILNDSLAYIKFIEEKRWDVFYIDLFWLTFYRLDFALSPQGLLKSEIVKAVADLSTGEPIDALKKKMMSHIDRIKSLSKEKLTESFYETECFLTKRRILNLEDTAKLVESYYKTSEVDRSKVDYVGSSLILLVGHYRLLHDYILPQHIEPLIRSGLKSVSEKSWLETSNSLHQNFESILNMTNSLQVANNFVQNAQVNLGQIFSFFKSK